LIIFLHTYYAQKVPKPKSIVRSENTNSNKLCLSRHTKWNVAGWEDSDELKYFDRHHIKCPKNYLLKYVKMELDQKLSHDHDENETVTRMRFGYTCCKTKVYSCDLMKTKPIKTGNAYQLHKMLPKCKCNKAIKSFRFKTKFRQPGHRNPKTHIEYRCCSFYEKNLKRYEKVKMMTQWQDSANGNTKFLSRHNIRCKAKSFITGFRLMLQDKNIKNNPSTRFDYTCVQASFKEAKPKPKPKAKNSPSVKKVKVAKANDSKTKKVKVSKASIPPIKTKRLW